MQIEEHLTQIKDRMARGERAEPESQLIDLMSQMGPATLSEWRPDIERIIREFQTKRRRRLMQYLDDGIEGLAESSPTDVNSNKIADPAASAAEASISAHSTILPEFQHRLDDLRDHHIFQWSTFYRDCLNIYFDRLLDAMEISSTHDFATDTAELLADHTQAVFAHGYEHTSSKHSHDHAIKKSLSGLSQFLAIPLDYYLTWASSVSAYGRAIPLRLLFSAAVSGILAGYVRVQYGAQSGREVLPRWQRQWMHYVAFLTPGHAERVIDSIEPGPLADSLNTSVLPMLDALQRFFERERDDYWPMPVLGHYSWPQRRLDIGFRPPRGASSLRLIEISAFLEEAFVQADDLNDALGRRTMVVIAPMKPDLHKVVADRPRLDAIVVPVNQLAVDSNVTTESNRRSAANRAFEVMDKALYQLRSKLMARSPITYNIAREFPLRLPERMSFFHVTRSSVRDLLRTFERRNGVRLWCSMRRSGKTTACLDMETTTGDSMTIPQTCGVSFSGGAASDATAFYDQVRRAVVSGEMVPRTFIGDTVAEYAKIDIGGRRAVLIIDEYETLFGLLKSAASHDDGVRYRAVQPILDQLVEFSRENLLVFLGQQPDAHFILMDQNQLAPYVTQDSFPLFEHVPGAAAGEFAELVNKILAERIECTAGFLDRLFEETAGHPFLTANVLVEFVEWLIEQKRPQTGLHVREDDISEFSRGKLSADRVLLSPEYEFFKEAAAAALSVSACRDNPWLFTVYWVLRLVSTESPDTFSVSRGDFKELMGRVPVPNGMRRPEWSEILRTATQANFLSYDDDSVCVKVRTLGRIAAAVQPALN